MTVQPTRDQLRALANAATPGPWKQDEDDGILLADIYTDADGDGFQDAWDREDPDIRCSQGVDAEFIAAARTAVPALLDALAAAEHRATRAETRIKAVEEALDGWDGIQPPAFHQLADEIRRALEG